MLRPFGNSGGGGSRQGCCGIGIGQARNALRQSREIISIQGLRRHFQEIGVVQECRYNLVLRCPRTCKRPALVVIQPQPGQHQIIDRRIGGPGIKGEAGTGGFGRALARVDPCQVANPAEVQKRQRRLCPDELRAGKMIEWGQRRALPAQFNVRGPEIPHDGHPQNGGQHIAGPRLMRAAPTRLMRQRLAVKANQLCPLKQGQDRGMGGFHHLGRSFNPRRICGGLRPSPQRPRDHLTLGRLIGAVGAMPEFEDAMPIGEQHCRIDPVKRCARHRPQCPKRS